MNKIFNGAQRAAEASRDFAPPRAVSSTLRNKVMKRLLLDLRDQELRKIHALLHEKAAIATEAQGDELDQARRDGDLEFRVSLLDLSESRLEAITATLVRLDEGRFGVCEECEGLISLTRLQSVPFARYYFDCQKEQEAASCRARRIFPSSSPTNLFDADQTERNHIRQTIDSNEDSGVPPLRRRRALSEL